MISIRVEGLDEVMRAGERVRDGLIEAMERAGEESAAEILETRGLFLYPPMNEGNYPPTPYWIRGRGMERGGVRTPAFNDYTSEDMQSQFYHSARGYSTYIGNRASYAPFVVGLEQAYFMEPKGWRILNEVATEKIPEITRIYQAWLDRLIREVYGD